MSSRRRLKLILVCGAWGGGTTAAAGMMASLGTQGIKPYYHTSDQRTPVSFESIPFRNTILRVASERTLTLNPGAAELGLAALRHLHHRIILQEFGSYDLRAAKPIFFKYPLSALLLPQICEVFDTRLIYVFRSLDDIEQTRIRRGWGPMFGRAGAEIFYRAMQDFEQLNAAPIFTLTFGDLLAAPAHRARELARFAGLKPDRVAFEEAVAFVRRD